MESVGWFLLQHGPCECLGHQPNQDKGWQPSFPPGSPWLEVKGKVQELQGAPCPGPSAGKDLIKSGDEKLLLVFPPLSLSPEI